MKTLYLAISMLIASALMISVAHAAPKAPKAKKATPPAIQINLESTILDEASSQALVELTITNTSDHYVDLVFAMIDYQALGVVTATVYTDGCRVLQTSTSIPEGADYYSGGTITRNGITSAARDDTFIGLAFALYMDIKPGESITMAGVYR